MKDVTARQQKLAAAYEADIWPLVAERSAGTILRRLPKLAEAQILDVGSAAGKLALAVAARVDEASSILGIEPSPALIALGEVARAGHAGGSRVTFQQAELPPAWEPEEARYDLVLSNLALGDTPDVKQALAVLVRALKPGGRFILTLTLRGAWNTFLDLYADVLTEQARKPALAALRAYEDGLPDSDTAARWLESAGCEAVTIDVDRWELLFKSAREFFFAPIIELGPLPVWKQIAGGRGDEMQDVFFFVKEAIETYFSGGVFPVEMVVGCLQGTKPAPTKAKGAIRPRARTP